MWHFATVRDLDICIFFQVQFSFNSVHFKIFVILVWFLIQFISKGLQNVCKL